MVVRLMRLQADINDFITFRERKGAIAFDMLQPLCVVFVISLFGFYRMSNRVVTP